jgi:hypothetical protein
MLTRFVLAAFSAVLFAHSVEAETVLHCRLFDKDFPSGRNESWLVTETHLLQLGSRYEKLDILGLAHKRIVKRSADEISATWDAPPIEASYRYMFEVNTRTGSVVETAVSRLMSKTIYGKCWVVSHELDGAPIPPHEAWKLN